MWYLFQQFFFKRCLRVRAIGGVLAFGPLAVFSPSALLGCTWETDVQDA